MDSVGANARTGAKNGESSGIKAIATNSCESDKDLIEKYIVAVGNAKAIEVINTQSKKVAGPCLSIVYDPVLNKLYFGQNYKSKSKIAKEAYERWLEMEADPIIQKRTAEYQLDIDVGKVTGLPQNHDTRLAAHSEVRALDQALRGRRDLGMSVDEDSISEMYLYNIDLRELYKGNGIVPKPRCENCSRITKGIITIEHN